MISVGSALTRPPPCWPASSEARLRGVSSSRSQVGWPAKASRSRRRSIRPAKTRKMREPRPAAPYLAYFIIEAVPAAGGVTAGVLANASWPTDRVSPRLVFRATALATACLTAGSAVAGTVLSTSTDTLWLSRLPGAITVWVTVLLTPKVVLMVLLA
jgi:hypothetical protein